MHAGGLIAEIDGSGAPAYHLTDALGSVRGLADLSGTVTGTSDYDVFGDVRAQTGATSIFDFTGEQRDTVTGDVYLRARYYEAGYGRFVSEDTVVPGGQGTQGFNRYAYVGNNPCTVTDPSGHVHDRFDPPGETSACWAVAFTLLGQAAFAYGLVVAIAKIKPFTPKWAITASGLALAGTFFLGAAVVTFFECIAMTLALVASAVSGASGPSSNGPSPGPGNSGPATPSPPIPAPPVPNPTPPS